MLAQTTPGTQQTVNNERIKVTPWPSEFGLKVLVILTSLSIWLGLLLSIFGIIYVIVLGLGFFFAHLLFIATIRGNAVRISQNQFPELYARIESLCQRAGLTQVPEAYIMQAGGSLNALATKFLRSKMIILFSDLLEACDTDDDALTMIIGHEIGHIKEGHLNNMWFLLPGLFVPFIGPAYSRAREFTCDRYGFALAGSSPNALKGLTILAAGPQYGKKIANPAFVAQHEQLEGGWMTLGIWMMSHPPLCTRIAALDKDLKAIASRYNKGPGRAILIIFLFLAFGIGSITAVFIAISKVSNIFSKQRTQYSTDYQAVDTTSYYNSETSSEASTEYSDDGDESGYEEYESEDQESNESGDQEINESGDQENSESSDSVIDLQ